MMLVKTPNMRSARGLVSATESPKVAHDKVRGKIEIVVTVLSAGFLGGY